MRIGDALMETLREAAALAGAVLFAAAAALAGLAVLRGLFLAGRIAPEAYDPFFVAACLLPAALVHGAAFAARHRGPHWWAAWLPGLAVYAARPWKADGPWRATWVFDDALLWAREVMQGWDAASDFSFNALAAFLAAALAAMLAAGGLVSGTARLLRRAVRDTATIGGGGGRRRPALQNASWASRREVRRLYGREGGIVVGEHTDPLRASPDFDPADRRSWRRQGRGALITVDPAEGNGHALVIAPSAGYKTAGIVIPNILHYRGPLVVFDPKGDLCARTRAARAEMGYRAVIVDSEHGFDPFKLIAPLAPRIPSVHLAMARTLMPASSRASDISEYFHEMSTNLFAALMAHFLNAGARNVAATISRWINRPREAVVLDAARIAAATTEPFIADELNGLAGLDERTWPGVAKGISNKLAFTRFPDVAAYGSSDASPAEHLAALEPDTDIFVSLPAQAARDFSSFPRLLLGGMLVVAELLEQPDRPRARRLFLVDEARVLGGMDVLANVRDAGRSVGMHLMLIYQSVGQMTQAWGGEAGAEAWLDSCEARVVSAVGSRRSAEGIAAMLGQRTVRVTTESSSASHQVMSPMGGSVSSSETEQLRDVPLMTSAALGRLPPHGSVIFTRRSAPILASKAVYFARPDMAGRVASPDDVADELAATRRRRDVLAGLAEGGPGSGDADPGGADPGEDDGGGPGRGGPPEDAADPWPFGEDGPLPSGEGGRGDGVPPGEDGRWERVPPEEESWGEPAPREGSASRDAGAGEPGRPPRLSELAWPKTRDPAAGPARGGGADGGTDRGAPDAEPDFDPFAARSFVEGDFPPFEAEGGDERDVRDAEDRGPGAADPFDEDAGEWAADSAEAPRESAYDAAESEIDPLESGNRLHESGYTPIESENPPSESEIAPHGSEGALRSPRGDVADPPGAVAGGGRADAAGRDEAPDDVDPDDFRVAEDFRHLDDVRIDDDFGPPLDIRADGADGWPDAVSMAAEDLPASPGAPIEAGHAGNRADAAGQDAVPDEVDPDDVRAEDDFHDPDGIRGENGIGPPFGDRDGPARDWPDAAGAAADDQPFSPGASAATGFGPAGDRADATGRDEPPDDVDPDDVRVEDDFHVPDGIRAGDGIGTPSDIRADEPGGSPDATSTAVDECPVGAATPPEDDTAGDRADADWAPDEDAEILRALRMGVAPGEIAPIVGRDAAAVEARIAFMRTRGVLPGREPDREGGDAS